MFYTLNTYPLILGLFFLFSLSSIQIQAQIPEQPSFKIAAVPSWVEPITFSAEPNNELNQPQRYFLVERQFNFLKNQHLHFYRQVRSPLSSSGVEQGSELKINYNQDYETLTLHKIQISRDGQTRDLTHSTDVRFIQQEPEIDSLIHTGSTTALFHLKDVRVGDVIEVSYSVNGKNPIFGNKPFGSIPVSWTVTVDKFVAKITADKMLKAKIHNDDTQIQKNIKNGVVQYSYLAQPTQAVFDEDNYPKDYTPYAWIDYSAYNSWQEVNQWAQNLYHVKSADSTTGRKAIESLSQKLSQKHPNPKDFAMAALNFTQNEIRYLGLEFGQNTHLPHPPEEVLQTRYGDCKDKALLLHRLLQTRNIESYPALVNSQSGDLINKLLPSPGAFDHVINQLKVDGKSYWVDATAQYQFGNLDVIGKFDYGPALLVGANTQTLVDMYKDRPIANQIEINESFKFKEFGGPVDYEVQTTYKGQSAEYQRYRFANNALNKIEEEYIRFYQNEYSDISKTKDVRFEDDRENNIFRVYESYNIDNNWKQNDEVNEIFINMPLYAYYLPKVPSSQRTAPYNIGTPSVIYDTFKIYYPSDVNLEFEDKVTQYQHPSFSYEYTDHYDKRVYTHSSSLRILSDRVHPQDLAQYTELRNQLWNEWFFSIFTSKPDLFDGFEKILKLKQRFKDLSQEQAHP